MIDTSVVENKTRVRRECDNLITCCGRLGDGGQWSCSHHLGVIIAPLVFFPLKLIFPNFHPPKSSTTSLCADASYLLRQGDKLRGHKPRERDTYTFHILNTARCFGHAMSRNEHAGKKKDAGQHTSNSSTPDHLQHY